MNIIKIKALPLCSTVSTRTLSAIYVTIVYWQPSLKNNISYDKLEIKKTKNVSKIHEHNWVIKKTPTV